MADITGVIPLSWTGIAATLVNALIAFFVILIVDKVVAHNLEAKHALIMSIVALFITPVAGAFAATYIALPGIVFAYVLPLAVWIIIGEILLEADTTTKLKVIVIAFAIYLVLSFLAAPRILSFIPGYLP